MERRMLRRVAQYKAIDDQLHSEVQAQQHEAISSVLRRLSREADDGTRGSSDRRRHHTFCPLEDAVAFLCDPQDASFRAFFYGADEVRGW